MATKKQVNEFIKKIAPIAISLCKTRGKWILPSVTIAQAACESNWGTSTAMSKANGLFGFKVGKGVKYGTAWKGKSYSTRTKEYYDRYVTITDCFRAYDTVEESVEDYMDLLCSLSRYKGAVCNNDALSTITAIKNGGYATSPTYINTIMSIIKSNNLTQYDETITGKIIKEPFIVGKNYILQNNMYIRQSAGGTKKPFIKLTVNAKSNSMKDENGYGILKKGTVVTCKEVKKLNNAVWIKIPSGWICGIGESGTIYVK